MFIPDTGSRIPDPHFSIPDPESRVKKIPDPRPHQRNKLLLTQKTVSELSEKLSWIFFPDSRFFSIPDLGVKKAQNSGSAR
jgi:hypothetical protein